MQMSIKNRIMSRIYAKGHDWVFSANDFASDFQRYEIDQSLTALTKEGKIRRIITGIYYYPRYSNIINDFVMPDIDDIAQAIARKFNWCIHPDGNTALNYLGISTQIVGRNIHLSDGPNRKYDIGGRRLEFKHIPAREAKLKYSESSLVVQALKSLREENITDAILKKIACKYSLKEWEDIDKDTINSKGWIREAINEIMRIKQDEISGTTICERAQ